MLKKILEERKQKNNYRHEEYQYLYLIEDILNENNYFLGRNGNTFAVYGCSMNFSLENNVLPLLTTKKIAWKTCLRELLWFISGNTSTKKLNDMNVKIWNSNSSRKFLDSRGLFNLNEGDIGPGYGFQWRYFNANYINCDSDYSNKGIDQLNNIISCLKNPNERYSRRLIMTAWNPCQIEQMALPPCHLLCQFNVFGNKLSCNLYQRSGDVGLGIPFNIASYSFLTHLLAHHCDLEPGEFNHFIGNTHIYDDHVEGLQTQIQRTPYSFPTIKIINKYDDIDKYSETDFIINNYKFHDIINLNMRQ